MRKLVLSLMMTVMCVTFVKANETDSITSKSDVIMNNLNDSVANLSSDGVFLILPDTISPDTLEMSVMVPMLEWEKLSTGKAKVRPDYLLVPLIYEDYVSLADSVNDKGEAYLKLNIDDEWLKSSMERREKVRQKRFITMVKEPQIVYFNEKDLPEPPKSYVITTDPSKQTVTITERKFDKVADIQGETVKVRNWIHSFNGSIQFSQAYLSDNWYQGGEKSLNALGQFLWNVKLNENVYKKLLFENSVQYKVGINSAPQDEIRGYSISQDLFQVNSKFGYKAIRNWYYSTSLQFKTQLLNNYVANTNDMKASLLSPAELNVGLGMTFSSSFLEKKVKFDMSLSPLSMDMNYCREIRKINPTTFGIDEGKHVKMAYGSNVEAKVVWKLCHEITWTSRLFSFTNYDHVQGDWENTFDFSINKYLSTRFYAHLRYDNSVAKDPSWNYWQFNEILSFGFNYKFSM